ncbi:MAG: peptidoglycan-binding protein [Clostridia bacterium]|nr:peptidoglycan-binding protein [Clostridia bacterium]
MKRALCFLLVLGLVFSVCAFAETNDADGTPVLPAPDEAEAVPMEEEEEDGDDSAPEPIDIIDMMEEEALEDGEEILQGRVLQYKDQGEDVQALQSRLKDLGYYSGKLSGQFGDATQKAVKKFQEDYDLEPTGIADLRTLSILFSTLHRTLRYGSGGEDVKALQTRLTELGYYKGKISGDYLEGTRKAVEDLQKKNGMEVTGTADSNLQDLLEAGKILARSEKPDDTNTPAPDLSNYLVDENEDGVRVADEPVEFTKKLKNGSSGKLVKQMQERLTELGYYEGPLSGNFQKYTTRAVKNVQTQNGLPSTGVVDEETWDLIFNDSHIVLPGATPRPTPEPTPVPFHIVVDVANQVTSVYGRDENGEYTVVVRQMLCSTGMKATPSDVGDWVLNGRHATWCIFPKWGNSYARYWTRINGSIAFHSPIYTAVSNSAMNISSYKKLGQRASHGCIRLAVWDAKWIYDNIGAGTVVSIVEGMDPDPELRDALKLPPLDKQYCTPLNTPVPTAEPEYSVSNPPVLGRQQLTEKSTGPEVYWVQRTLKDLGYYDTKCTGKFLKKTLKAVKAFQQDHGLKANGGVTQEIVDKMAEAAKNLTQKQPEAVPTPAP